MKAEVGVRNAEEATSEVATTAGGQEEEEVDLLCLSKEV